MQVPAASSVCEAVGAEISASRARQLPDQFVFNKFVANSARMANCDRVSEIAEETRKRVNSRGKRSAERSALLDRSASSASLFGDRSTNYWFFATSACQRLVYLASRCIPGEDP